MTKRIISLLLILVLSLTFLGSCGNEKEASANEPSSIDPSKASTEESSEDESSESPSNDLIDSSVNDIVANMTLWQKIGQMIMPSIRTWNGEPVTSTIPEDLKKVINKYHVGNIILFAENFGTAEDTVRLTHSLNEALSIDIPMFIGADQEGGNVVRLNYGCSLVGNMALGAIGSDEDSYIVGKITGEQLSALGLNLDLAPTLDVNNNPANPVINIRSFSEDPDLVARLGISMIKGMQDKSVSACAKHFPGHGDTETDSHYGLPSIDKSYDEIKKMELVPFQAAIDGGIDMIMTAHIQFPQVESEEKNGLILPATLSKKILTDILKEDMGFNGVVITDSMHMDAIASHFSMAEASILAINAGVDILLMPVLLHHDGHARELENFISSIVQAVASGKIPMSRINDAVTRIITAKKERGLWEQNRLSLDEKIANANQAVGNAEHKAIERKLATKAVTVLENKSGALFADMAKGKSLLFAVPSEDVGKNVEFMLNRLISENKINISYLIKSYEESQSEKLNEFDGVVILTDTSSSWEIEAPLKVYEKAKTNNKSLAVISCRIPYDTALFTEADCLLACYCPKGGVPQTDNSAFGVNIGGAIEVLLGVEEGQGKLPVTIYNVSKNGEIDFDTVVYPKG